VGDELRSQNALVPLSIDRTSSAEVAFTDAGFSVEVAGGAKDRTVQRSGDRSFFADTRTDTDALIVPTAAIQRTASGKRRRWIRLTMDRIRSLLPLNTHRPPA
jgi:hypothetical protein